MTLKHLTFRFSFRHRFDSTKNQAKHTIAFSTPTNVSISIKSVVAYNDVCVTRIESLLLVLWRPHIRLPMYLWESQCAYICLCCRFVNKANIFGVVLCIERSEEIWMRELCVVILKYMYKEKKRSNKFW